MNPAIALLNGVDVTEYTRGIETLSERIFFDKEIGGYLVDIINEVEFDGEAFNVLQEAFFTNFDKPLPFLVSVWNPHTQTYDNVFNSLIYVAQGEFNLYRRTFTVSPTDRSFFSKIRHNANLEFTIGSGVSKLGVDISARSGGTLMRAYGRGWFNPPTLFNSPTRPANTVFQCLDFLLAAMTDGELPLVSDFLTTGLGSRNYLVLSGSNYCSRSATARRPITTWNEFFSDIAKLFNLVFAIEVMPDNSFQMRIEPISYFRKQQLTRIVDLKPDAVERIDASYLYSRMLVGSAKTAQRLAEPSATWQANPFGNFAPPSPNFFNYIPATPFFFHTQESYIFEYESNADNELNLRCSRLITDTNLHYFQMAQFFGKFFDEDRNEDYDEDIFLIYCEELGVNDFAPIFYTNSVGLNYLNDPITNINVGINNADGLPASAGILFQQFGSQSFRSAITAVPPTGQLFPPAGGVPKSSNVVFTNITTVGGLWSTPLSYFSAPSSPIQAASSTAPDLWLRASFNDVTVNGFDNSTGYDTTGAYWDTQIAALYSFRVRLFINHNHFGDPTKLCGFDLYVVQWDSGGVFKSAQRMLNFAFSDPTNQPTSANAPTLSGSQIWREVEARTQFFNAALGDVFQVVINIAPNITYSGNQFEPNANILIMSNDSHWEIFASSLEDQGGTILESPKGGNFLVENEFEADIAADLWNTIKANIFGNFLYQVGANGEHRNGFLKDFEREIISGRTRCLTSARLAIQPDIDNIDDPEVEPEPAPDEEE
jgi:hypothetical protein